MRFTKKDWNQTLWVKPTQLDKEKEWYHVDANGQILWRMAVDIAMKLQGKHKTSYCDFWDAGDFVVVTNVEKLAVTGYKMTQKEYHTYSGRKGNVKSSTLHVMMQHKPEQVLWLAVRGMLPKNKLRDKRMKRLKMFVWESHDYGQITMKSLQATSE